MLAFFIGLGAAITALVVYTVWGVVKMQAPTNGKSIKEESRRGTALLIIDVQSDFTKEHGSRKWEQDYLESRLEQINALAELAKHKGWSTIVVRHVFKGWYTNLLVKIFGGGLGAEGSDGLQMDPRVRAEPDLEVVKSIGDAFEKPQLSTFLKSHQIGHLILTGLDGNACVKNTAIGALNRGYRVELCDPAILAYNQKAWKLQKEALQEMGAAISQEIVESIPDANPA